MIVKSVRMELLWLMVAVSFVGLVSCQPTFENDQLDLSQPDEQQALESTKELLEDVNPVESVPVIRETRGGNSKYGGGKGGGGGGGKGGGGKKSGGGGGGGGKSKKW
ncbi:dormancy-associated protein 2-like isoform X1 [Nilaparvata lugens]|uniref:dormancy-associated protein 2-like isoform X1 n=1 Tax=Nilaparvata lugens TaxID=108931 RepID=UPI00193E8355|nr:dormancy-associated protein 2-like isoform X1 [Nilaparvata lugens]